MLKHFLYKKENGNVSERFAHPMGVVNDKLFAVDLTEYDADERKEYETVLNEIHKQYIEAVKAAGLGSNFRYFFFNGIKVLD